MTWLSSSPEKLVMRGAFLVGDSGELSRWLYKDNAWSLEKTGMKGYRQTRSWAEVSRSPSALMGTMQFVVFLGGPAEGERQTLPVYDPAGVASEFGI